jgi:hypothetical protein
MAEWFERSQRRKARLSGRGVEPTSQLIPANVGGFKQEKELKKIAAVAVLISALTGCSVSVVNPFSGRIDSSISVFHQMPAPAADATFTVLPWRKENQGSLEFNLYAEQLATQLKASGLTVTPQGQPAKYAVLLDYGIDTGRTETDSFSVPYQPAIGVTAYRQQSTNYRVFSRFVHVDIMEITAGGQAKKVYEGRLKSEGSCRNLTSLMPIFLGTLFTNFPGESGKAITVTSNWDGRC